MEAIKRSFEPTVTVDGRTILAYFSTWNNPYLATNDGRTIFTEMAEPYCFDISPTTRALYDHNSKILLAKMQTKNLELTQDEFGLLGKIKMPNTSIGNDIIEMASRGEIGCSFGGDVVRSIKRNGITVLQKVKLSEVSFTFQPANENAGIVSIRSLPEMDTETEMLIQNWKWANRYTK